MCGWQVKLCYSLAVTGHIQKCVQNKALYKSTLYFTLLHFMGFTAYLANYIELNMEPLIRMPDVTLTFDLLTSFCPK